MATSVSEQTVAGHTPGPLNVVRQTEDGQFRIDAEPYGEGKWSDVYINFSGYFGAVGPYVFAAAPELLEALRVLVREAIEVWEHDPEYPDIAKALDAIAKATGGSD